MAGDPLELALEGGDGISFINVSHNIMGAPINGITKFSWKKSQEKVNRYGAGALPYNRVRKAKKFEGTITVFGDVALALEANAPTGDMLDYPPFIIIGKIAVGDLIYTVELTACEFTDATYAGEVDNDGMEVELPVVIGNIKIKQGS
jgi:hypothetical protein